MLTPSLYHGPTAEATCIHEATLFGRLLRKPFGMEGRGLKKDEAREVVQLNRKGGLYPSSIVIGRLDIASPLSSDALLKVIEEPFERVGIFLWADDLGGVSPTIRSRCRDVWCPNGDRDEDYAFDITLLYQRWADQDLSFFIEVLRDNKKNEREVVESCLAGYSNSIGLGASDHVIEGWLRLRELLSMRVLTPSQVIEGLFGGMVK